MKRIESSSALALRSREYDSMLSRVVSLIDDARRVSARTVNALMTATYWSIGRHVVEFELSGKKRAEYGEELLERLAADLTRRFGRGFSRPNLQQMRQFYQAFPVQQICQMLSDKSPSAGKIHTASEKSAVQRHKKSQTASDKLALGDLAAQFPLPWSAYVRLLSVKTNRRGSFMRRKRCAEAGACDSSIARSTRCFTTAPRFRGAKQRCLPKPRSQDTKMRSRRKKKSKIRTCWTFSDSRMNTLSPKLKQRSFCISNGSC